MPCRGILREHVVYPLRKEEVRGSLHASGLLGLSDGQVSRVVRARQQHALVEIAPSRPGAMAPLISSVMVIMPFLILTSLKPVIVKLPGS
jgi:hypothetical protein